MSKDSPSRRYTIKDYVFSILCELDENVAREGLIETPERVEKFYKEFFKPKKFKFTVFDSEHYDELILQKDIPFFSLCEHHMLPFFGKAYVAYIPNGHIVGLSKLARAVDLYSRRLQNQERLTSQVAERIAKELDPKGVAVVIKARHLCMEMRGIKTHDTYTVTSKLMGAFKDEPEARAEIMSLINEGIKSE